MRGHDTGLDDLGALDLALLLDLVDDNAHDGALFEGTPPPAAVTDSSSGTGDEMPCSNGDPKPLPTQSSRLREKQEIEHLRQQVGELERDLAKLQQSTGRPSPSNDGDAAWKRIALHQMNAKQRAEAENERLRQKLEGQLKIARGLERLLRKRADIEGDGEIVDSKRQRRHDSLYDERVYAQLSQNLDALYARFPQTYDRKGLATNKGDIDDISFIEDTSGHMMIEMLSAKSGPFDLKTTNEGIWKCCTMSHLPLPTGHFSAISVDDGILKSFFVLPIQIRRQSVTVRMRIALKRFEEPDAKRVVYIWDSLSTLESPQKTCDGVQFLDNGWTVVEELPTSDVQNPSTLVQFFWQIVPDMSSFSRRQSPVGMLSDVLIATYTNMFQSLSELLENVLVDTMLAQRMRPREE